MGWRCRLSWQAYLSVSSDSTIYDGTIAACGLAQGLNFLASVAPCILRGITLKGIDSVTRPIADRVEAWERFATILTADDFADISTVIGLDQVIQTAGQLLEGKVRGRVVVDASKS